jgi:homocysteine S-methyltransferase
MLADGSEYRGGYAADDEALARHHRPRLAALAGSGADLLAFETLPSLREALVLAHLLREFPGTLAWFSFSCRDGLHTSEGDDIGECAARLRGFAQITAVGINCTAPRHVASLLQHMHGADKPLLAYPNSGETYHAGTRRWQGSGGFAAGDAQEWYDAGARLIGGCCRTTPDDIRALRSWAGAPGRRH